MADDRPLRMETADPKGVFVDLGAALREGAMRALKDSDTLPGCAADLIDVFGGPALKSAVAARIELFVKGHTPEGDRMLPISLLVWEAQQSAARARSHIGDDRDTDRDLVAAEASLATTAAYCLAAIDRLRAERGAG